LETNLPALKNLHVKAEEYEEEIIFLHKVDEGRADQSYGIHVAKLAELPDKLLNRASVLLKQLEEKSPSKQETSNEVNESEGQLILIYDKNEHDKRNETNETTESTILKELKALNILELTKLESKNLIYKLHSKIK